MDLTTRAVTPASAVQDHLQPEEMALIYAQGYRSIINNRPDDEEAGQPAALTLEEAARAAGLHYVHIPVVGVITAEQRQTMREALAILPQPVLAFCRSGARSTRIWAHAMEGQLNSETIMACAAQAGCDVQALATELTAIR